MTRLHVLATGLVQGVGFRWFVRESARRLDLAGWVLNRPDGAVEVMAEGEAAGVAALRAAVSEGPAGARVDGIQELPDNGEPLPRPFGVRR
ncbi:MAG TPA: acylphosphatase [Gemmatimonadaceae bacterium]|jgi:acylphosphatase|nr:acylphosphatase [Gemmatimonadaceae bacterium]